MEHELKIDDVHLKAKLDGDKLFEIRENDRGFQKGDIAIYAVYPGLAGTPAKPRSDGPIVKYMFVITYVTNFEQQPNWVVFGERRIS